MKKHDEKKQGTIESVSSRNCMKKRNKTNTVAGNAWMRKKTKSKKRQKKTRQA